MSKTTRRELTEAVGARYRDASVGVRSAILDEFVAVTGYHRKHAIRVLRSEAPAVAVVTAQPRHRLYDEAVHQALVVLWEAGDRVCGKRLKALLPALIGAMERHGHLVGVNYRDRSATTILAGGGGLSCEEW